MGRSLVVAMLALAGLLSAAGMGYAAYIVSRDSVAVPVTRLQQKPQLAPLPVRERAQPKVTKRRPVTVSTPTTTAGTTVDDHAGRGGSGSGGSGSGGGGHGSDD